MIGQAVAPSQAPKNSARSLSAGDRIALIALLAPIQPFQGPMCFNKSLPSPSENQIEAGDQTINFRSQSTPGRRPSRNVIFPPRLPPITALILAVIGVFFVESLNEPDDKVLI